MPASTVIPVLIYPDVRAAVAWLTDVFGFAERLKIGEDHRSQMSIGEDGAVIVGDVHGDRVAPGTDGTSHAVTVRIDDVHAHCEHARRHGATILMEPVDFEYGERQYMAADLAGHQWTFSETLVDVNPADWGGELV